MASFVGSELFHIICLLVVFIGWGGGCSLGVCKVANSNSCGLCEGATEKRNSCFTGIPFEWSLNFWRANLKRISYKRNEARGDCKIKEKKKGKL